MPNKSKIKIDKQKTCVIIGYKIEKEELQMKHTSKRNFVAKNMNTFNKPATHVDRKRKIKSGEVKHKKGFIT